MLDRTLVFACCVAFALAPLRAEADAPADSQPPLQASAIPLEAWAGEWVLDPEASDSPDPLLELLETPWVMRKLAGAMTPRFTFRVLPDGSGLHWVNENPISRREREVTGDGIERTLEDPLGNTYTTRETWSGAGELRMTQTHARGARRIEVVATWQREADTIRIVSRTRGDDGPIEIRRVFRREP